MDAIGESNYGLHEKHDIQANKRALVPLISFASKGLKMIDKDGNLIGSTQRRLECLMLLRRIGKEEKDAIGETDYVLQGKNSIKGGKRALVPLISFGSKGLKRNGKDGKHGWEHMETNGVPCACTEGVYAPSPIG